MLPDEIIARVNAGFNHEVSSINMFRKRFLLMQNLRTYLPELPEYIVYYTLRKLDKQFNFEKDKEEFIQAFLNEIFPILSAKITK